MPSQDALATLAAECWPLATDLSHIPLHPAAARRLNDTPVDCCPAGWLATDLMVFYTDGSFQPKCPDLGAGWAFAVLRIRDGATSFMGAHWGSLSKDDPSLQLPLDARAAEVAAIAQALRWRWTTGHAGGVTFYIDATVAVGRTEARQIVVNDLEAFAQQLWFFHPPGTISWYHVKGHVGDGWNELVDSLAKWALQGPHSSGMRPPCPPPRSRAGDWAWLQYAPIADKAAFPRCQGDSWDLRPLLAGRCTATDLTAVCNLPGQLGQPGTDAPADAVDCPHSGAHPGRTTKEIKRRSNPPIPPAGSEPRGSHAGSTP